MRAFVAVPTPTSLRTRLSAIQEELGPRLSGVRFVRPESIHLTLRFLGETSQGQARDLEGRLRAAAAACPRASAPIGGLGLFPERGSPRVLWVAVSLSEPALALQRACEAAAVSVGFPPEERPFRPHLTLGRWKDRAPRPELPAVDLQALPVEEIVLYQSDLVRSGAVHTPLTRFPLGV
jgi:2'-5' RNA ligase